MSFRSGVVLQLGALTTIVNIDTTATEDKSSQLKIVCTGPDSGHPHQPTGIRQQQRCPECGNVDTGTFRKAQVDGDQYKLVDATEVESVKTAAQAATKSILNMSLHPAAEVENGTVPSGKTYQLSPHKPALAPVYGLLVDMLQRHPEVRALVQWTPTSRPSTYEVKVAGNRLVMEEKAAPEQMKPVVEVSYDAPTAEYQAMVDKLVPTMVTDFDPAKYADTYARGLESLLAAKAAVQGAAAPKAAKSTTAAPVGTVDLSAMLNAALAGVGKP
jgi:non-homologous end joining protein Ku